VEEEERIQTWLAEAAKLSEQPKGREDAEPLYGRVLSQDPAHQEALVGLGVLMVRTGRGPAAMKRLQRAQRESPGSSGPLRAIAVLIRISGYLELGERYFLGLLDKVPVEVVPYVRLGLAELYAALGRKDRLLAELSALEPHPEAELLSQALLWMESGDVKGLLRTASRAKGSLQPSVVGMACELQSKWQEASGHHYSASLIEPPTWICLNSLAAMWLNCGDLAKCRHYLERATALAPMAAEVQLTRSRYLMAQGYREDSRLLLQRLSGAPGNFAKLRQVAGNLLRA
jgi:Flp pilus assembly protein TadD